tara:strand:+ start:1218 stop:1433 length:216 start_codon:yes stop_codon:yes gene_type:complete
MAKIFGIDVHCYDENGHEDKEMEKKFDKLDKKINKAYKKIDEKKEYTHENKLDYSDDEIKKLRDQENEDKQ